MHSADIFGSQRLEHSIRQLSVALIEHTVLSALFSIVAIGIIKNFIVKTCPAGSQTQRINIGPGQESQGIPAGII